MSGCHSKPMPLTSPTVLEAIAARVQQIAKTPGCSFEDFSGAFVGWERSTVTLLFNQILEEILEAPDGGQRYFDQIHLYAGGDFNLTLVQVGRPLELGAQLCASEFDMLVVNLLDDPVSIPVYRADLHIEEIHKRPNRLRPAEQVEIEPYRCHTFKAYAEIADLAAGSREAPFLVAHSRARGTMTWVFDRESLEPVQLTANYLQSSRLQIAVHVIGEMGGPEDIENLERLACSDYTHFVRWEAAESVYKLDSSRGTGLLKDRLATDTHPSIREAARLTLDKISGVAP
jgi:HEAT repeats